MTGVPLHYATACGQGIDYGIHPGLRPCTWRIRCNIDDCRQYSGQNTDRANSYLCCGRFGESAHGLGLDNLDCGHLISDVTDDETAGATIDHHFKIRNI